MRRIAVDMGIAVLYCIMFHASVGHPIGTEWSALLGVTVVTCVEVIRWGMKEDER